jgi:hypothetical protein
MSVDRGTMNRTFRGERSSDRDRCPGTLPVMLSEEPSILPADMVTVSMGPLPRGDVIDEFTDLFRDACRRKDPEVLMESALWFYSNPRNFDPAVMGGLVPAGNGERKRKASRGSLVIMGGPPELRGTQVEGTIELLGPGDEHYEFLLLVWKLFLGRDGADGRGPDEACLFRTD